jgi:broad specificity phosphatase PhoE
MTKFSSLPPIYLARHAETVFNKAARLQGQLGHSPLTLNGFGQAEAMGKALLDFLGAAPDVALWCSSSGRTRQTMAIICEILGLNYMDTAADDRLQEIHVGDWEGLYYHEVRSTVGPFLDQKDRLFMHRPPGGEWYDDIALRMKDWLGTIQGETRPLLVISHGMASRVLRGLLAGGLDVEGTAIAEDVPQGTVMRIENGSEQAIHIGNGVIHDGLRSV